MDIERFPHGTSGDSKPAIKSMPTTIELTGFSHQSYYYQEQQEWQGKSRHNITPQDTERWLSLLDNTKPH